MIQEQILQDLKTLSPDLQQEVLDFIAFLQTRYEKKQTDKTTPSLGTTPFVGMWADRDDMEDSSTWLRSVRTQEWG